jgi:hypothetical protein
MFVLKYLQTYKYPHIVKYSKKSIFPRLMERLKKYPNIIKRIPKNNQTQEMIDIILKTKKILSLSSYVNPKFIDMKRLKKYPEAIKCIPQNDQTQEMIDIILEKNKPFLLNYVDPKFINVEHLKKYPKIVRSISVGYDQDCNRRPQKIR